MVLDPRGGPPCRRPRRRSRADSQDSITEVKKGKPPRRILNPPPGVRTEGVEAGLDARKACIEERSVVGYYVSTAEVRLTTQTGPSHPHQLWVGHKCIIGQMPR